MVTEIPLTINPQILCSPVLSQNHTLSPKKEENQRKSPTYYFVLWLVKMFLNSFFFSLRNNLHTMKCTNIKCRALNLYTPIHPCNLYPSQDIRHKGRTYKEKKRLVINCISENTDRCLSLTAMGNHSGQQKPSHTLWLIITKQNSLSPKLYKTNCIFNFKTLKKMWMRLILNEYFQELSKLKEDNKELKNPKIKKKSPTKMI